MKEAELMKIHKKCCEKKLFIKNRKGDAIPVPMAFEPTVYNEDLFNSAIALMPDFNSLVDILSENLEFLDLIQKELEGTDSFMESLFKLHKESIKSSFNKKIVAGLSRNDFLVSNQKLYQVELNTLSCSFMALSQCISELYQELYPTTKIPINHSLEGSAELFRCIHQVYSNEYSSKDSVILVLTQENERNSWDQEHLLNEIKLPLIKKTFKDINGNLTMNQENGKLELEGLEISAVYFRTGYVPQDYFPNEAECWNTRALIEKSRAVKVPNVGYQLIGKKIVQQLLKDPLTFQKFTNGQFPNIPKCFTGLWSCKDKEAVQMAVRCPENFVLKPQRDGGSNNLYGDDLLKALNDPNINKSAFTLMEFIKSPTMTNSLISFSSEGVENTEINVEVVCELGIYGSFLKLKGKNILNKGTGYLLRTKNKKSKESGIMAGFGYFDSPSFL